MERCEKCHGYYGEPKIVNVGEKCCFTITTSDGRSFNHRAVTGKLLLIKDDGYAGYTVTYRNKVYHADLIAHPDDPSPITLTFIGYCKCSHPQPPTGE
ncbi:hypothetical protein KKJ01_14600 [Xenorhabdus bovienii]|uniref:Uncharacterized protein n=1 Tax=Xenorhabdus bovienii TaxID=40576 RepID=A0AAJ1J9F2_XENBV|nr:hypothetical protein [Xenorhabdus bovienii]MDE1479429.1 hypothetical protein [Xenorhabdus bovienii]MDE9511080.1 hypothetical protein [Xenorhabdus bovienii]MDE9522737.1 hypothetical protein [Xenorhabdus bovienii]